MRKRNDHFSIARFLFMFVPTHKNWLYNFSTNNLCVFNVCKLYKSRFIVIYTNFIINNNIQVSPINRPKQLFSFNTQINMILGSSISPTVYYMYCLAIHLITTNFTYMQQYTALVQASICKANYLSSTNIRINPWLILRLIT